MPSREQRRHAAKNGVELPLLSIRLYGDGSLHIDKHGDMTADQVRVIAMKALENLPDD